MFLHCHSLIPTAAGLLVEMHPGNKHSAANLRQKDLQFIQKKLNIEGEALAWSDLNSILRENLSPDTPGRLWLYII
jgi:hypothetical protein